MTRDQVKNVQASFRNLAPFRDYAAEIFYERLFEIDPSLEPSFDGIDMRVRGETLMAALAVIVGTLQHPETLLEGKGAIAVRQFSFGLQERHHISAGRALISMLERMLGHDWTNELWVAWAAAYAVVSGAMTRAAGAGAVA